MNTKNTFTSATFPKASEMNNKPKIKVPDLSSELYKDQKIFYQFDTSIIPPPLSTTSCFIHETTNSDPHLIRSTMYALPDTVKFFENLNIPLGIVVTPFNFKSDCRRSLQYSIRCINCTSYANIHWKIKNDKVYCNICKYPNPIEKICNDYEQLNSVLKYPTYELNNVYEPTYEYKNMVDSEYFQKILFKHPVFVFVFDTSYTFREENIDEIINVIKNETFQTLYKKVVFIKGYSIYSTTNYKDILEYSLELSPFIPPDVFLETERISEDFLLSIFKRKSDAITKDKKDCKNIQNILTKISRYSYGSKVIVFSDNITTIENIPSMTIYYISPFSRYKNDLYRICCTETFFNVSVEVKTSNGIAKNAVYTDAKVENITNVEIASMDCNSSVAYTFFIDEYITDAKAYIQVFLNYFTYEGEYKTLVLNQSYKVSKHPYDIFNGISFDTLFACFCKYICKEVYNIKHVEEMICKFLKFYRSSSVKDISITQFVLPESAKLLPVLYQALVKNNIFNISNMAAGKRKDDINNLIKFSVEQTLRFFYPKLFTLTDYYVDQDLAKIQYLKLSMSVIDSNEIFVLENGQKIFLYIGKGVDPCLKEALFKNEEEYAILMKLVDDINGTYGYELPIVVIEEGKSPGEAEFIGYMIEDNMNGVCSYYDYVCELHFKVQRI